ncbi:hypothetical protein GALL_364120 [mine drainage metagenome]|uniref:Ribbon-helix-helix protein CopG domain-containing protein n=1 Tax=mine drainage metagenome TaxID=410659 RepID=A0A1J5QE20_9ZZZZ
MSAFPKRFEPDIEVNEIDLDTSDVRYRGEKLTEARADEVAADVLSRTPGRPSLSGKREPSPSLTVRLPQQSRSKLDTFARRHGKRPSQVVRDALDEYLSKHAG